MRGIEMRRREREKRHREKEGGSTDEDTWSGKNGEDSKSVTDDKPSAYKVDKPDDRHTERRDTTWQTDRRDTRDTDWRADRTAGRSDADWQTDRHHGRGESDWRVDRHQRDTPDWRGDRHQGPPDRHQGHSRGSDWRSDRFHWHSDRRQSGRDGHSSDMHRSTYRRQSPSPRQQDQRFVTLFLQHFLLNLYVGAERVVRLFFSLDTCNIYLQGTSIEVRSIGLK